jgi:2-polyprenyl-3-methyl-5-hydroxy-6-metoxy-1,4-benzoquinol methylase
MAKETNKKIWKNIYTNINTADLPWCVETIPDWFKGVIKSKWIKPCKTMDVGCGIGNFANYLAENGFEVTAIDFVSKVIAIAKKKFSHKNLKFKVYDALKLKLLKEKFDFIFEISLLHNIVPNQRASYVEGLYSRLNKNGKLMICCFSDQELIFGGKKIYLDAQTGNTMYPLSKKEIIDLFSKYFYIEKLKKVFLGRKGKRRRERFLCLMVKKDNIL